MDKISLEEAKKIKLMNRIDRKYIINFDQYCSLAEYIVSNYYIVVNNEGNFLLKYKSIYFDTNNYDMYTDHKNDIDNRQKIRIREYENGDKFLEIKTKKKDSHTQKIRIVTDSYSIDGYKEWIKNNLHYDINTLNEKLEIEFRRITVINKEKNERITIDFGINFYNYMTKIKNKIPEIIVEVKKLTEDKTNFEKRLNDLGVYETKFSKYHTGINLTQKEF